MSCVLARVKTSEKARGGTFIHVFGDHKNPLREIVAHYCITDSAILDGNVRRVAVRVAAPGCLLPEAHRLGDSKRCAVKCELA